MWEEECGKDGAEVEILEKDSTQGWGREGPPPRRCVMWFVLLPVRIYLVNQARTMATSVLTSAPSQGARTTQSSAHLPRPKLSGGMARSATSLSMISSCLRMAISV